MSQPRLVGAAAEEDAARTLRRQSLEQLQGVGVPDLDFLAIAHRQPELIAAGGELHVQHGRAWLQIGDDRSEEHTSELQSLMRISYAVFCLKNTKKYNTHTTNIM